MSQQGAQSNKKKFSPRQADLVAKGFIAFIFLVGAAFIIGGWNEFKDTYAWLSYGVNTRAEVVGLGVIDGGVKYGDRFDLVFKFVDSNGEIIEVASSRSYVPYFLPYGDDGKLPLIYNPKDPSQNNIDTFLRVWGRFIMVSGFGVFLSLIALMCLIAICYPNFNIPKYFKK